MKETMMEENPYRAMGEEIAQLEAEGKLPEGFDLEAACNDDRFVELLYELEPYGAIRVYAAERAAEAAVAEAREELRREVMGPQRRCAPNSSAYKGTVEFGSRSKSKQPVYGQNGTK